MYTLTHTESFENSDLGFEQFCTSCYRCKEMLWGLGGGNHTIEECMRACQIQKDCKFLSFSSEGHCHMSSKCDDKKPGAPHWTTYRRSKIYKMNLFLKKHCFKVLWFH